MLDDDKKAALRHARGRRYERDAHFLEANFEANDSLRESLQGNRCMPCEEGGIDSGATFLMPAKGEDGGVGLLGFCFGHFADLLNSIDDDRSLTGVPVGRAALPVANFGDLPSLTGPDSLRHVKCGVCS